MRRKTAAAVSLLVAALVAGASALAITPPKPAAPEWVVGSEWRFTIVDTGKPTPSVLTFRVSSTPARSCMGGDWRRLELRQGKYSNLSEPAWMIADGELKVLLASDVCDAYDEVGGKLSGKTFSGQHYMFGLGGSDPRGKATAVKLR